MLTRKATQPAKPKDLTAGKLISLMAEAFGQKENEIAEEIARMAAAPEGDESDPTRETIMSYIKAPTKRKNITRRNRLTPIHQKFAHLAVNYLDGRRPDRSEVGVQPVDESAWREARSLCRFVLRAERDKRFERTLGTDLGKRRIMDRLDGVFAVCRRDSGDKKYHQELLILRSRGDVKARRYDCTYVTQQSVARGEWYIIGDIVFCNMSGWRRDNSHELGGLYLAYLGDRDLLTGFLAGAGTEAKIPVAMPLVAVRIQSTTEVHDLGDLGDEFILGQFQKIDANLERIQDRLAAILEKDIPLVKFEGARDCSRTIREVFSGATELVHPRFKEFCGSSIG